ncbi:MAG: class C sortase [Eubacteriales bacterium]|nr:class C sortase [Eubacteriales bacterium]
MKNKLSTILLIFVFLIGLSLLLYPTVSDYWNSLHQTRAIAGYAQAAAQVDNEAYDALLAQAAEYNRTLPGKENPLIMTDQEREEYSSLLDISGTGIMGYIEIPQIKISLPIYHGTGESVLQTAVGHIEGTSLPVGGESTHCVLSGHRGLPSAKLFTDLDELTAGDLFVLHVLDETLTYEVDQILIVEPEDVEALGIQEGKDYCTLVTCTPYGINTHRLLVRGHRVENQKETVRVSADAVQIRPVVVAPMVAVPLVLFLVLAIMLRHRKRRNRQIGGKHSETA